MSDYTPVRDAMPPKDTLIEWIGPDGRVTRGKWAGGGVWYPEGSNMYVYYTPEFWRVIPMSPHHRGM